MTPADQSLSGDPPGVPHRALAGVTLSDLTFYGESLALDFNARPTHFCEAILIEHCYLLIRGDLKLTVSLVGCRMRNYAAGNPITILNPNAVIQAVACVDKSENPWTLTPR
jgi:hypothetical protein